MGFQKKDELTGFSKKGRVECPSTEAEAAVSAGWSPGCWGEGGRQTCTWNKTGGNTQRHSLKYTKYSLECNNRELHKEHKNIIIKRNLVELNQSPSQFFTWNRWRPADKYMQTSGELHIRRRRILTLGNYSPAQKETNRETGKKGKRRNHKYTHAENVLAPKVGKFKTFKFDSCISATVPRLWGGDSILPGIRTRSSPAVPRLWVWEGTRSSPDATGTRTLREIILDSKLHLKILDSKSGLKILDSSFFELISSHRRICRDTGFDWQLWMESPRFHFGPGSKVAEC